MGQAFITPAFNLPNSFVIHVSAPKYHFDPDPPANLALCISNVMKLAEANGVKRIAFPAIATGVYGYPMEDAIDVFIDVASKFINSEVLEEIRFVFASAVDASLMKEKLFKSH